jgi:hypothetical protein
MLFNASPWRSAPEVRLPRRCQSAPIVPGVLIRPACEIELLHHQRASEDASSSATGQREVGLSSDQSASAVQGAASISEVDWYCVLARQVGTEA